MRASFFFLISIFLISLSAKSSNDDYYFKNSAYVPQKKDYGFELGTMIEKYNLYWIGVNLGFNRGTCFKLNNPYCQQYFDFNFGAGGREAETHYVGSISPRFQWINYPSSWSPFVRFILGVQNSIEINSTRHHLVVGAGAGITRQMHEHLDVRFEIRANHGDQGFLQAVIGMQLKIDELVESFGDAIKGSLEKMTSPQKK